MFNHPRYTFFITLFSLAFLQACHHGDGNGGDGSGGDGSAGKAAPEFRVLEHDRTGLDFSNTLKPTKDFNVFDYMYFYNGGGIGAGDFNNDGKIDLFFAANQGNDKIFLNTGNLHFRDITTESGIPHDNGWSTGVSVVDINGDGLLDIYVCRVGQLAGIPASHNLLLICTGIDQAGIPHYKDEAKQYGLDFSGFSTQAAFFDYDGDGDLDMYLLNHSIHQNGTFGVRANRLATTNPLSGDRLYRNDGKGHFTDVTAEAGIYSSVIGYGLGIDISDIDLDGHPDIYVCNDFHENDYLYINQHNGTFRDERGDQIMHTSQFSMGVDIADINNDGFPEIISMDMLPYDAHILKRSLGEDTWDTYFEKIGYGYDYQYTRNNLQLNRRNGHFSEIGLYSGVAATDWSWSPLWVDFDNDGFKDLFISNGIPKRLNDIDYINFVSNQELQQKMANKSLDDRDLELINRFPEIKLPSKFFQNSGDLQFTDLGDHIAGARPTYSNGAIYADLDGDGDLDLVVNNIDEPALVYQNLQNDKSPRPYLDIALQGSPANLNALGARLILFSGGQIRTYEKYPVHGFMSSEEMPVHIGLYNTAIDSLVLVWPDNTCERLNLKPGQQRLTASWQTGLPLFNYAEITGHWTNPTRPVHDITAGTGLLYRHVENDFREFDREPLIPHMVSTEGPALAIADINKDGLDDVFIGSSKWKKPAVFLQDPQGRFQRMAEPDLDNDSSFESVDAAWVDVNNDGSPDLVIAPGGNEFFGQEPYRNPRIYLNDGKAHLRRLLGTAFDTVFMNASCVAPCDFNGDGKADLFIGGRSVAFDYGKVPRSYLFAGDGNGHFRDVTAELADGLTNIGFVTSAQWFDLDKDGQKDLLLTLEWGGIVAFMNQHGHLVKKLLSDKKGWWNFVLPVDLNGDGQVDLVAGNLGLNTRLKASAQEPVRLYYYDFDGNGKKEQILTYYLNGRELPFANVHELETQLPGLKKNFLYAADFSKASLEDLFSREKLQHADTLTADYFSNAILINQGDLRFVVKPMPWQAQLSPYRDAVVVDANGDSLPDILLVGNYYDNNIEMGRYDADYGTILLNKGHDSLVAMPLNGLAIKGQIRHIRELHLGRKRQTSYVLVKNNDSARVIRFGP
jgi:hypothetical protein